MHREAAASASQRDATIPPPASAVTQSAAPPTPVLPPVKRKRIQAPRTRLNPFEMLELLTSEFDAGALLREVEAVGFSVPLLQRIDAAIAADNKSRGAAAHTSTAYRISTSAGDQLQCAAGQDSVIDDAAAESHSSSAHSARPASAHAAAKRQKRDAQAHTVPVAHSDEKGHHSGDAASAHLLRTRSEEMSDAEMAAATLTQVSMSHSDPCTDSTSVKVHSDAREQQGSHSLAASQQSEPSHASRAAPTFPFVHLDADSLRFRKTDVTSIDWKRFRKRSERAAAPNESLYKRTSPATAAGAPVAASAARRAASHGTSRPRSASVGASDASDAPSDDDGHTAAAPAPSPPAVSFEEVAAGLTKRQARFLHTGVNLTNVLSDSTRRRAWKPQLLPWEQVDWKGRMKDE